LEERITYIYRVINQPSKKPALCPATAFLLGFSLKMDVYIPLKRWYIYELHGTTVKLVQGGIARDQIYFPNWAIFRIIQNCKKKKLKIN
jgi:hypothetical protein